MLVIAGSFRIPAGNVDAARPVMSAMVAASRAEPGCLDYSYGEDVIDPGLIRVTERWADAESLEAHAASDHIAAWRAAWPALGIGERDLTLYEVSSARMI